LRHLRMFSMLMPVVVAAAFLCFLLSGRQLAGQSVKNIWVGEYEGEIVPLWGVVKTASDMAKLSSVIPGILEKTEDMDFSNNMFIYLVTGSTDEDLKGYEIFKVKNGEGFFSVLCRRRGSSSSGFSCQVVLSDRMDGEGIFCFE